MKDHPKNRLENDYVPVILKIIFYLFFTGLACSALAVILDQFGMRILGDVLIGVGLVEILAMAVIIFVVWWKNIR